MRELADGAAASDDEDVSFSNRKGEEINGYGSHIIEVRVDSADNFKKARWKTLGAEVINGSTLDGGASDFIGGYSARGKSVPVEKVPADVIAAIP